MNSKVKPKGFLHVGQGKVILKYKKKIDLNTPFSFKYAYQLTATKPMSLNNKYLVN